MDQIKTTMARTDWALLAQQKLALVEAKATLPTEAVEGLLAWIDAMQDAAAADGFPVVFLTEAEAIKDRIRVAVYHYDDDGKESREFDCYCWLDEAIERDDPEYAAAEATLRRDGRYWVGGGAAPLVLLMRVG